MRRPTDTTQRTAAAPSGSVTVLFRDIGAFAMTPHPFPARPVSSTYKYQELVKNGRLGGFFSGGNKFGGAAEASALDSSPSQIKNVLAFILMKKCTYRTFAENCLNNL
jgi:hypothetical protein